jgi:hypothetical protein
MNNTTRNIIDTTKYRKGDYIELSLNKEVLHKTSGHIIDLAELHGKKLKVEIKNFGTPITIIVEKKPSIFRAILKKIKSLINKSIGKHKI